MKGKRKFPMEDTPLLKALVQLIGVPARRHRCGLCDEIFECHLCDFNETHELHSDNCDIPFCCESCIGKCGLESVMVCHRDPRERRIYDHVTGEVLYRAPIEMASPCYDFAAIGFPGKVLSLVQVLEIRRLRNQECLRLREIAERMSISMALISRVARGDVWGHIPDGIEKRSHSEWTTLHPTGKRAKLAAQQKAS